MFEASGRAASDVGRISTEAYFADKPQAATPLNSVLDPPKITATGFAPRDRRTALAEYLAAGTDGRWVPWVGCDATRRSA